MWEFVNLMIEGTPKIRLSSSDAHMLQVWPCVSDCGVILDRIIKFDLCDLEK
jgi:hypothetical protein